MSLYHIILSGPCYHAGFKQCHDNYVSCVNVCVLDWLWLRIICQRTFLKWELTIYFDMFIFFLRSKSWNMHSCHTYYQTMNSLSGIRSRKWCGMWSNDVDPIMDLYQSKEWLCLIETRNYRMLYFRPHTFASRVYFGHVNGILNICLRGVSLRSPVSREVLCQSEI